jgi:hypothetical protein
MPAESVQEESQGQEAVADTESMAGESGAAHYAYVGTYTRGAPGGWSDAAEATHPEGIAVFAVDPEAVARQRIVTVSQ